MPTSPKRAPAKPSKPASPAEVNKATIERLYAALARLDAGTMASCYAADATFSDAVFVGLKGPEVPRMWTMLAAGAKDLSVATTDIAASDEAGQAHVEARYAFSRTGRKVHNVIEARFRFADGRIVEHHDSFSFWRWSRQALGWKGFLFGWTPFLRGAVRKDARRRLDAFVIPAPATPVKLAKPAAAPKRKAKAKKAR